MGGPEQEPFGLDVKAAARIGGLAESVGTGRGAGATLLEGLLGALWATSGTLTVCAGDAPTTWTLGDASDPPPGAPSATRVRRTEGGRGSTLHAEIASEASWMVLVAGRGPERAPFSAAVERAVALVDEELRTALQRLAFSEEPTLEPHEALAWETSNVPLAYLRRDGSVVRANPSAVRKLDLPGHLGPLPDWLVGVVGARLDVIGQEGLPDGVSGDYSWMEPDSTRGRVRVGLAPVDDGGIEPVWLLSIESGGMTPEQRLQAAAERFRLTPREREVLGSLALGLRNKEISVVMDCSEATVKFHLNQVMRKLDVRSRTALVTRFYTVDLESSG